MSNIAELSLPHEVTAIEATIIDTDSPNITTSLAKPELWNPNVAGLWSLSIAVLILFIILLNIFSDQL